MTSVMQGNLSIQCKCGELQGTVTGISSKNGYWVVCYCDDCQAFAHFLGNSDRSLDAHGGTDLFQMSPARLRITQGIEQLACVRLTRKGPFRWYSKCCKTPVGNTPPTYQLPFIGLIHSSIATAKQPLDELLGSEQIRVMGKFAIPVNGELPDAHGGFPLSHIARILWKILGWRIRGDHRHSPFFDRQTGEPIAAVQILSNRG